MNKHIEAFGDRKEDFEIFKNMLFNAFIERKLTINTRKEQFLEKFKSLRNKIEEIKQEPIIFFENKAIDISNSCEAWSDMIRSYYSCSNKLDFKNVLYYLRNEINKNKSFRENYIFYYVDYVNNLTLEDVRDILLCHDKYNELDFIQFRDNLIYIKIDDVEFNKELKDIYEEYIKFKKNIIKEFVIVLKNYFKKSKKRELVCSLEHIVHFCLFNFSYECLISFSEKLKEVFNTGIDQITVKSDNKNLFIKLKK